MTDITRFKVEKIKTIIIEEMGFRVNKSVEDILISPSLKADSFMNISVGNLDLPLALVLRSQVLKASDINDILEASEQSPSPLMIGARKIENEVKLLLKERNIAFYEEDDQEIFFPLNIQLNSRAHESQFRLKRAGQFQNIETKMYGTERNRNAREGFTLKSYVKILITLTEKPDLLYNYTQRDIAKMLEISLGATNNSIRYLTDKSLIKKHKGSLLINNVDEIILFLRRHLSFLLRNGLIQGRFSPRNEEFFEKWKEFRDEDSSFVWGGECAANIKTGHLSPGFFEIYTNQSSPIQLVKKFRLKNDPMGKIIIKHQYWDDELNSKSCAPDIITICDLYNSGVDRNIETAEIMVKNLKKKLENYE